MQKVEIKAANVTEDSRPAGPQLRITRVAGQLRKYSVTTHVIHSNHSGPSIAETLDKLEIEHSSIRMTRPTLTFTSLIIYIINFIPDVYRVFSVLVEENIDIVHCNGPHQVKGAIAAKVANVPAIWHVNDTQTLIVIRWIFFLLSGWLADGYIVSSHRTKREYNLDSSSTDKPVSLIRPPVDTGEFNPRSVSPDTEVRNSDGVSVITVCNVTPIKNLEMFINVCNAIDRRCEGVSFYVVGPVYDSKMNYYRHIKKLSNNAAASIEFTGYRQNIPSVLKAADLFLCTSRHESGPLSVFEAMSMSTPVITTDVGDIRRIVPKDSDCCQIVEQNDVESMCSYSCKYIENDSLIEHAGLQARRLAIENFSLKKSAKRHHIAYKSVLKSIN